MPSFPQIPNVYVCVWSIVWSAPEASEELPTLVTSILVPSSIPREIPRDVRGDGDVRPTLVLVRVPGKTAWVCQASIPIR